VQGKIKIEKQGKSQSIDFGRIGKREFKQLVKRYVTLGYKVEANQ